MGARNLTSKQFSLERNVVRLFAKAIGAGAANPTGVKGKGISAITRTGTGLYTIALQDWWPALLMASFVVIDPTSTDDWEVSIVSETVATASTKAVNIAVFKSGAAADLSTDETLKLELVLSNTKSLPRGW